MWILPSARGASAANSISISEFHQPISAWDFSALDKLVLKWQNSKRKVPPWLTFHKRSPFFEPIKRNKFKTMSSTSPKRKLVASNQKVIQYKAISWFIFQIFIKSQLLTWCAIPWLWILIPFQQLMASLQKTTKHKGLPTWSKMLRRHISLLQANVESFKTGNPHSTWTCAPDFIVCGTPFM